MVLYYFSHVNEMLAIDGISDIIGKTNTPYLPTLIVAMLKKFSIHFTTTRSKPLLLCAEGQQIPL
jgi:hypothetical protein